VGIFTNNFQDGLLLIQEFKGSPRQLILDKKLTINDSIEMWRNLFEKLMINKHLQNLNGINNIDRSVKNNFIIYAEYIIRNKLFKPIFGSRFLNLQDKLTIRFFRKSIVLILKKLNMYDFVKGIRDAFKL
jgi:hypothetical protein